MNIKKLINESIRKVLNEKVYGKLATVFHSSRTPPEDFIPLLVSGEFNPGKGAGAMYGPGLYTVFQLKGSKTANFGYGDSIYKLKLNLDGFLILNVEVCKKVYGKPLSIKDQLLASGNRRAIQKFENNHLSTLINLPLLKLEAYAHGGAWDLDPGSLEGSDAEKSIKKSKEYSIKRYGFVAPRTAPFALELVSNNGWMLIPGIIYTGDNDGLCALVYDGNAATPLAYTKKEDVNFPKEKNPLVAAIFGVDSESSREEKDFTWTKLSKEQIKKAVGRIQKKGNTKDLLYKKAETRTYYTYNEIGDIFNFPSLNHMQNSLHMIMSIDERIKYILKNHPDIMSAIKGLTSAQRIRIIQTSIMQSLQARSDGVDYALSANNIIYLAEIFDINTDPGDMLQLGIFLLKEYPSVAGIVIKESGIANQLGYVAVFLIYFIENRLMRVWRLQEASKSERAARRARREANYLGLKGEGVPPLLMPHLQGDPKIYFPNTLKYYTQNKELILNQTNSSSDYSFEIFKTYAGYPYAFKQFIYDIFLRKDPRIIEHQKADPSAFNEKKVNFFNEQD
jgi:hypothetical protein